MRQRQGRGLRAGPVVGGAIEAVDPAGAHDIHARTVHLEGDPMGERSRATDPLCQEESLRGDDGVPRWQQLRYELLRRVASGGTEAGR
jgi:hypothetical protein